MAVAGRGEVPQIVKNIGESVDVEKSVEISQAHLVDKVVEVLVARCVQDLRRHAVGKTGEIAQVMTQKLSTAAVQTVARTMEGTPHAQLIKKVVDISVVAQREIPVVQTMQKTIEMPQLQHMEKAGRYSYCGGCAGPTRAGRAEDNGHGTNPVH